MRCGMKKPHSLKVRRYLAHLIKLNECLASLSGATFSEKIGVIELNGISFSSMPNIWSKEAYAQCFDCEYILLNKSVDMFD